MRIIHDYLTSFLDHSHVVTDDELISFKEICNVMIDKIRNDKILSSACSDPSFTEDDGLFALDSFTDDDNLLDLDDINTQLTHNTTYSTQNQTNDATRGDLGTIEEEYDDFEQMLKEMSLQDMQTMQMKLSVELAKDDIRDYIGVSSADDLDRNMQTELELLQKEQQLLELELIDLQSEHVENECGQTFISQK